MAQAPEVVEDSEFETPEVFSSDLLSYTGDAGTADRCRPLRWWRTTRHVERSYSFAFADTDSTGAPTTAIVTIHKRIEGTLHILTRATPDSDTTSTGGGEGMSADNVNWNDPAHLREVRKPIEDHWVRRLLLKRVGAKPVNGDLEGTDAVVASYDNDHGDRPRWRIVASSGVEVTSKDATTRIQSLRVQSADLDTTLTDPLAFFRLRKLIKVNATEPVKLTVTTGNSDDLVFLFSRAGRHRFHNNGDGTFSGTWHAPWLRGIRHAGVNAFSNGTLLDDKAPYDSKAWILPYVVTANDRCDYLPRD